MTSSAFTQGGQTHLHRLRMLNQVLGATLKASLALAVIYIGLRVYFDWQPYWNLACFWKLKLHTFMNLPEGYFDNCHLVTNYGNEYISSTYATYTHKQMLNNPVYLSHVDKVIGMAWGRLIEGIGIFILSFISISMIWSRVGKQKKKTKIVKGTKLVQPKELKKQIKKSKQASDLQLADVPLIKGKETQHMLIAGTTGAGKTNAINELLMQIRERGDRAIIVDSNGDFLQKFFRDGDSLLNPLDERSVHWDLWSECTADYHFHDFAECLIPSRSNDPFWSDSARQLFVATAKKLQDKPSIDQFLQMAIEKPLSEVKTFYQDTPIASIMCPEGEKTTISIRTTLMNACRAFSYLAAREQIQGSKDTRKNKSVDASSKWSIKGWLAQNNSDWLFLSCPVDQRGLLKSFFTGLIACASRGLMNQAGMPRKTWFIIDELPSLEYVADLPQALAEVRKYNGCFVLGLQNLSQLEKIYGHHDTKTINSLTGTKLTFRLSDVETARHMASFLGEQEILDPSESISFGAHQMRDGVSLGEQRRIRPTVDATTIMQLEDLQCYLTLPGNFPLTKLEFNYHDLPYSNMRFVSGAVDGRTIQVAKPETDEGKEAADPNIATTEKTTKEIKSEIQETDKEIEDTKAEQEKIHADVDQELRSRLSED